MGEKPIRFTKHARQKFDDLAAMGFTVTEEEVIDTIRNPEQVDTTTHPPVAQKPLSDRHLLRVVFEEYEQSIVVITFYPSRRSRYEP